MDGVKNSGMDGWRDKGMEYGDTFGAKKGRMHGVVE